MNGVIWLDGGFLIHPDIPINDVVAFFKKWSEVGENGITRTYLAKNIIWIELKSNQ